MNNRALFSRFSNKIGEAKEGIFLQGTLEEAEKTVLPFLEKGSSSIAVYGIGLGYHFDALRGWLTSSSQHQLVFIEDNLEALALFLNSSRAEMLLMHPQVSFVVWQDEENIPFLANLTNDFYFIALSHYQKKAEKLYPELLSKVYQIQSYLSDLWLYKEQANFYSHLATLDEYRISKGLKICQPLIIFGAGPSISKYLPFCTNAVVTASGTGMNLLNAAGMEADFGIAFDPKPSGERRMQANSAFQTPYVVDMDAIGAKYLNGPKVLIWHRTEAKWKERMLERLGIKDQLLYFEPAITSTHYALQVGAKLGCPEIALVGVDLAYVEGKQYPGPKTWVSDKDPHFGKDLIEVITEDKRKVRVSRTYYQEALIYREFVKTHPEIRFYNASKEGQTIDGMEPIGDLTFPKYDKDVKRLFLAQERFKVSMSEVKKVLLEWKEALGTSPELMERYNKRLELKLEAKRRYFKMMGMGMQELEKQRENFCQKVIHLHREAVEKALEEIEEKLAFPKKEIKDEIPCKEGKLEGKVRLYYDSGQLKSESDFINGKREGVFRFYARSGTLLEEVYFKGGIPVKEDEFNENITEIQKLLKKLK